MKIALKQPIEHEGATYAELTLREAELGDLIAMEDARGGELAKFTVLLSRISGVPAEVIGKLKASDLQRIQRDAGSMLGNVEEDGGE